MTTITIPKKITKEIKIFIGQAVHEVLNDPDFGLALTATAKKRLKQVMRRREKAASSTEIKRNYY